MGFDFDKLADRAGRNRPYVSLDKSYGRWRRPEPDGQKITGTSREPTIPALHHLGITYNPVLAAAEHRSAECRLGEMMEEQPKAPCGRPQEIGFPKNPISNARPMTLSSARIDKNIAHRARTLPREWGRRV